MKKFIAIVLVLCTVLGLCACGGGSGSGNKDYQTADGKIKLSIGVKADALIMDFKNNALTKWVEEKCNVDLEFVEFAGGSDVPTQISTTISARQDLPDMLALGGLSESFLTRYGNDGYFIDLQDYFADKEGASKIFWDRLANEMTEDQANYLLTNITDPETGAMYSIPMVETSLVDKLRYMAWINVQWLDKLGLEKPTSTEELKKVLRAFKNGDPNGNGKADEIPLYGTTHNSGGNVLMWLMNMCTYYNNNRIFMVDENDQIWFPYTTDGFRDGLRLINELYEEGLLTNMVWSSGDSRAITTPSSGTALCGIFVGHLTLHTQMGNEVLYQYEPLKTWGYAVRDNMSIGLAGQITDSCAPEKRDKAFEVFMTLWSWEGSMRMRYGEYGVNWTDPDPGAVSDMGLEATYKLNSDPLGEQNTCRWPSMVCFNNYAECETAQIGEMDKWTATRCAMHAQAYKLFCESEESNPVEQIAKPFVTTEEEQEKVKMERTNVDTYRNQAFTDFCQGVLDINSDAAWKAYIDKLYELGLQAVLDYAQNAYDRTGGSGFDITFK